MPLRITYTLENSNCVKRLSGLYPQNHILFPSNSIMNIIKVWYTLSMDTNMYLKTGMTGERSVKVTEENIASAVGSGGLAVFSTPYMVALMEGACVEAVDKALPDGFSTVGTVVEIKHLAATPVDMNVRAVGELTVIDGRELCFRVEAFDDTGKIGEGTHKRFIIENEKFMAKVRSKFGL